MADFPPADSDIPPDPAQDLVVQRGYRWGQEFGMLIRESCLVKGAMGCVAGFVMGYGMGFLMAPMDSSAALDPELQKKPMSQQIRKGIKDMGRRSSSFARNFAAVGGMFSLSDCVVEKWRGKHDWVNPTLSGSFTGAVLAIRGGPQATLFGAVGFGAFSLVIDKVMERWEVSENPKLARKDRLDELELELEPVQSNAEVRREFYERMRRLANPAPQNQAQSSWFSWS